MPGSLATQTILANMISSFLFSVFFGGFIHNKYRILPALSFKFTFLAIRTSCKHFFIVLPYIKFVIKQLPKLTDTEQDSFSFGVAFLTSLTKESPIFTLLLTLIDLHSLLAVVASCSTMFAKFVCLPFGAVQLVCSVGGTKHWVMMIIMICGFVSVGDNFHIAHNHLICCYHQNIDECSFKIKTAKVFSCIQITLL